MAAVWFGVVLFGICLDCNDTVNKLFHKCFTHSGAWPTGASSLHSDVRIRASHCRAPDIDTGLESLPGQQGREMWRGTNMNVSAGDQHMKAIHIHKSMMSAPFLQHQALTAGQRRYLCSIANVYSTERMRQQMKQHYLNVLHTCVQSGQNPACRRRHGDHRHRENSTFTKDAEKDVTRAKPQGQRKSNSSNPANSDVILPKIINR